MAKRRIFIAEDNALVLMSLEGMVEDMGWELVGPAETRAAAERLAAECEADVALLDVNLNGERSFPAALTLARRGVPVVFATGYESGLDLPDELKDMAVVTKPFRIEALEEQLRAIVGDAEAEVQEG